jgi:two-component system sensor kinase FixL
LNLLLNALEAAQSSAGVRAVLVRAAADPAGFAEISVRDTGEGIPADRLERVFDPFYTTKAGGMGMGLSIARSIVSAHGGAIWAEAAPGGGALFRLRLPPHVPA